MNYMNLLKSALNLDDEIEVLNKTGLNRDTLSKLSTLKVNHDPILDLGDYDVGFLCGDDSKALSLSTNCKFYQGNMQYWKGVAERVAFNENSN